MFYIKHKTLGILVFKVGKDPRYLGYFASCIDVKTAISLYGAKKWDQATTQKGLKIL